MFRIRHIAPRARASHAPSQAGAQSSTGPGMAGREYEKMYENALNS